jgi:hypothetical protein
MQIGLDSGNNITVVRFFYLVNTYKQMLPFYIGCHIYHFFVSITFLGPLTKTMK